MAQPSEFEMTRLLPGASLPGRIHIDDEQLAGLLPRRNRQNWKSKAKFALVIVIAIPYILFCFVVLYCTVPIPGNKLIIQGLPSYVHVKIDAFITTSAILIISVALWPLKGLVDEIKSEEFFRLVRYSGGVPLKTANAISTPMTGIFDIFLATCRCHCSWYLTSTILITLAILATSSFAPAASLVLKDTRDPSFTIGAIPPLSFMITGRSRGFAYNSSAPSKFPEASALSWVENKLNFTNVYYRVVNSSGDPFGCIVPFPPKYTTAMRAYWTTDVIVLNPSCSWQTARLRTRGLTANNSTASQRWDVTLSEANLYITVDNTSFVSTPLVSTMPSGLLPTNNSLPISDGSVVFFMSQLDHPISLHGSPFPLFANLSNIPTLQFTNGYTLAFLVCSPHATIQTYDVRTTGDGIIKLGQLKLDRTQGNLDLGQVNYLLSFILRDFENFSGPSQFIGWTDMMLQLIFGDNFRPWLNTPPAPTANITAVYKQVIQSAMKTVLSGAVDTAIVPGGPIVEQVVFKSSLSHVIVSTVLFVFLILALRVARPERAVFTLIDVAAAMDDSDVPMMCRIMKEQAGVDDGKILRVRNGVNGVPIICATRRNRPRANSAPF